MSTQQENANVGFTATAALSRAVRVKLDTTDTTGQSVVVAAAADTDNWIGVTTEDVLAGQNVNVRLKNDRGTFWFTAAAAIAQFSTVKVADLGQVAQGATTNVTIEFINIEAATAQGDIIECIKGGLKTLP